MFGSVKSISATMLCSQRDLADETQQVPECIPLRKADNTEAWTYSLIPRDCWLSRSKRCKTLPSLSYKKY